ncbi:hypothetical protein BDN67DRAFT_916863 [Paxillus ammoniavirescens]|nr:hypothetical protein BDN67DRAFT_916863 [Paxillus ammoniavirescens]
MSIRAGDRVLEVPKLDASGKDWFTWKNRLVVSLTARGLVGYLHGTEPLPISPAEGHSVAWIPTTTAEFEAVHDYDASTKKWVEEDAMVKQQIIVTIPNSLFVEIMSRSTSHEYYEALRNKFKNRSIVVAVEK